MSKPRTLRRLAAILAADVVGYSRLMERDEAAALADLKEQRDTVIEPLVGAHHGRIVKLMGDGTLAEFSSVVDAVQCAIEIQSKAASRNAAAPERKVELRIGINLGDVIPDGDDIYGEGVNVAARLEALCRPGGICISGTVHDAVGRDLATRFEFAGEQTVKNIEKPVRTYMYFDQMQTGAQASLAPVEPKQIYRQSDPSLALKPFENLSGDPAQQQFVDAMSNGILVALARMPGLILVHDESPQFGRSKTMTEQEFVSHLNVQYLLKGDLRKLGEKVRVSVQLMEVSTGQYRWAEKFDRILSNYDDLFSLQDEIIEQIVTALDVKLLSSEAARVVRKNMKNPTARDYYARGEHELWSAKTTLEIHNAQHLIEQSILLEPTSSVGYATAALAYWIEGLSARGDRLAEVQTLAEQRSRQAIERDDVTGYPRMVLAHLHLHRREFEAAYGEAANAVSARPSCPGAYALKASVLNYLGEFREAIEHAKFAMRLTPIHPPMYPATLASALYSSGRYQEAIAAATTAADADHQNVDACVVLVAANLALGRSEEARRVAANIMQIKPEFTLAAFAQTQPYRDQRQLERLVGQLREAGLQ